MTEITCWNCGELLADIPLPISRHDNCPECFTELHCCRLCRYYDPQIQDQCEEDAADPPANKEYGNFCEWFQPTSDAFQCTRILKKDDSAAKLDALFTSAEQDDGKGQPSKEAQSNEESRSDVRSKLDSLFSKGDD